MAPDRSVTGDYSVLAGNLLAALPATMAARTRAGAVLRTE